MFRLRLPKTGCVFLQILSVKLERLKQSKYLDLFNRILQHIIHIVPGSRPTSCYGIDISHGPKRSKKRDRYVVEIYFKATHARKVLIAINALDESSSEKDASSTVNVTERATTSES